MNVVWLLARQVPEHESLGGGQEGGEDPGDCHHQSGPLSSLLIVNCPKRVADHQISEVFYYSLTIF